MTSAVRVLMAVPQYPYPVMGGLERQSHELAKALLGLGIGVQALSGKIEATQARQESVEGVLVHRIPWPRKKYVRFLRTPFDVFAVLFSRRDTYDIVHLHQFSWFGAFVILLARALGKPVLTKLPSVGATSLPGIAASPLGTIMLAIFRLSDAVVAMSSESLAELAAAGYPLRRVLRTPNGIRLLTSKSSPAEGRSPPGECRVVFVGRLSEEKRIADILQVWQRVTSASTQHLTLELWGTGPDEAAMKALCVELDIANSVRFCGHVESVRVRLEEMDIFILTSVREGNSNAILEAMAAGLPVVSTAVGGTPMLVGPEGSPYLVEPGDLDGLHERLIRLIEDRGLRLAAGEAMLDRIRKHFDMRLVARTYAAAYGLLAGGRRDEVISVGNPIIQPPESNL